MFDDALPNRGSQEFLLSEKLIWNSFKLNCENNCCWFYKNNFILHKCKFILTVMLAKLIENKISIYINAAIIILAKCGTLDILSNIIEFLYKIFVNYYFCMKNKKFNWECDDYLEIEKSFCH